ncbi:MAG: OmpA family protein [Candidatus Endonucleobacter sp. (ex Gigantidas childressi)]|nr:OmpA family protein [Candidatus Endonucleobacter sp. (ex Gigantidas childressi)]
MQIPIFIKVAAVAVTSIWLVGCSSAPNKQTSHIYDGGAATEAGINYSEQSHNEQVDVETTPIWNPSVQAVIDSRVTTASPEEIEEMLNQHMYNFKYDSAVLNAEDYTALDVQAAYLNSNEGMKRNLMIEGHTDERGTRTYNLALGERRANVVKNYLLAKGVAFERIEVVSFGFEKPLDLSHDDTAWYKNRRAIIVVQ